MLGLDVMRLLLDLGFQVLFVCQDVSVPLGDGLILAHPDLLSNLEKEAKTVTILERQKRQLLKMFTKFTCWISLKSWLTSIMPPSNSLMASASASMVSMSR